MEANPSADKFAPPPENARRERMPQDGSPKKPKSLWPLVVVVTFFALQYFFESKRGWGSIVAVLVAVAGYAAEAFFHHQEQAARGGPDPYTPPTHITR